MQTNEDSETHTVSTASQVLTRTERRYSVAERELMAIVFALDKFRNYIFGYEVYLHTDNKALSFLGKCALNSNRLAGWIMQIQEYNLYMRIQHIRGADNFLADKISRNLAGLRERDTKELFKPKGLMVATINLGTDNSVGKSLKDSATFQAWDKKIQEIIQIVQQKQKNASKNFMVQNDILYSKDSHKYPYWRPVLPTDLEISVIRYVHTSLGHLGTEKCIAQTANTFHVKGLGWKVRKFISPCDTCQWVKYPNRSCAVQNLSHLPTKPGDLWAVDLYGPLPVGRFRFRYIFLCFDVFLKSVTLYPLKAATTKACLNKVENDYVVNVTRPKCILSGSGTHFSSNKWKDKLAEMNIGVMFSPICHPQANPSERCMKEIGKFCRTYSNEAHKRWPELLSHIEGWLNGTLSNSTSYSPVELIFDSPRPDLFEELLKKESEQKPKVESLQEKGICQDEGESNEMKQKGKEQ